MFTRLQKLLKVTISKVGLCIREKYSSIEYFRVIDFDVKMTFRVSMLVVRKRRTKKRIRALSSFVNKILIY